MKSWKKLVWLLILISVLTTSCWNRRELSDLGLVMGVAIDAGEEEGTINFTSQVIKPDQIKTGAEQVSGSMPYFNITSNGQTVFEAIRKCARLIDRRLYFPHSLVIIVSEEIARQGITQHLDLMLRDPEFRRDSFLLISKGRAADILSAKTELDEIPGRSIYHLVKRRIGASLASGVTLLEFTQRLLSDTTAPVASHLELTPGNKVELTGTAVFKKDKLVGYLDEKETRGLLWGLGEVISGIVVVDSPEEEGKISLEIVSASGKIIPRLKGEELQMEIIVRVQVHLAEQAAPGDLTNPEDSDSLKKELVQVVEKEITAALNKARDLNCDIFAFGREINKKYPRLWEEIKNNWDELFPQLEVDIKVEPTLTRSGMTKKAARTD